jgi:hypothetical protein
MLRKSFLNIAKTQNQRPHFTQNHQYPYVLVKRGEKCSVKSQFYDRRFMGFRIAPKIVEGKRQIIDSRSSVNVCDQGIQR